MGFIVKEKQMKYTSKDVEKLKEQLDYFLFERDESIVISLQGYWGIGKTYFWNDYIKDKEECKYAYVSLFGINSIDEIKRKIILKISDRAKLSNKLQEFIGNTKIFGVDLSSAISILDKKDFKDVIICFDDFERISSNLSISEILGFISELKEQHNCRIVLINNNEVLKEQDDLYHKKIQKYQEKQKSEKEFLSDLDEKELFESILNEDIKKKQKEKHSNKTKYVITSTSNYEIFEQFSEKIVDIRLKYEPSIDDLINIVKNDKRGYIDFDFIVKFFNSLENQNKKFNLRLIKQLILKLEIVEDFLKCKEIEDRFKRGLIFNIARLVVKENVRKFDMGLSFDEIDSNFSEYKDELFDLIYRHRFDVGKVKNIFIEKSKPIKQYNEVMNFRKELEQIYSQYLYDMQYSDEKFIKELKDKLEEKDDIVDWLGLETFYGYIEFLKKIDKKNNNKYDVLYEEKVKKYIEKNINSIEKLDSFFKNQKIEIINKNNELKEYYEKIKNKKQEEKIISLTKEEISNLIDEIYKNRGWGEKQEKLFRDIPYDKHKEWIISDKEYFRKVLDFIKWLQSFSGNKPFNEFYNTTIKIYRELSKEEKYKNKMNFVLERLNIKDIDEKDNNTNRN